MLDLEYKGFGQLTARELYAILQLRSEVFVVEQECVYQDMDGQDEKALHITGTENGILVAYTRSFRPGDYFKEASIGRVLVRKEGRQYGYGKKILAFSMDLILERFGSPKLQISAQKYLEKFYSSLRFLSAGEEYLEDGIQHIAMVMTSQH